jgi:ATP-dependent DNA ligase
VRPALRLRGTAAGALRIFSVMPRLDVPRDLVPMEAEPVDELPSGPGWLYEPKYDGFRCLAYRSGDRVDIRSRNQRPLGRYFPELCAALRELPVERFVLDGEIVIRGESFETLQLRLHPAASRIVLLSKQYPATLIAFDLLADESGRSLLGVPFAARRSALRAFMKRVGKRLSLVRSKATRRPDIALSWLHGTGHGLDGIVAKRLDLSYRPGERAMQKYKLWKTIDCVVGGLYRKQGTKQIESLLLGLYDGDGRLNYVGRAPVHQQRAAVTRELAPLVGGEGFTGRAPGGKNRWSGRERKPVPLQPRRVVEVSADHITGDFMRHGARILRWRTDKRPRCCTMDQIRKAGDGSRNQRAILRGVQPSAKPD